MFKDLSTIIIVLVLVSSFTGILITSLQTGLTWHLTRRRFRTGGTREDAAGRVQQQQGHAAREMGIDRAQFVSILKPLSGLEDGLEENLASFAILEGVPYEVILSVADPDDPAIEVVERVRRRFPAAPFVLVIGRGLAGRGINRKVSRLVAAAAVARGDIFFISDSNVRVSPHDIAETLEMFDDPAAGCVSNPFVGEGNRSLGAVLENQYLLSFVVPGNVLACYTGVPCVVGKSMAIRREVCDAIGGFQAFSKVLAEDQSIGLAVRRAGYQVVLSPVVVKNFIEKRRLWDVLARQIRWGKIRYSFSKTLFSAEILVNPFALASIDFIVAAMAKPAWTRRIAVFLAFTLAVRLVQSRLIAWFASAKMTWRHMLLIPVQDLLQALAQAAPYFSKEVTWRGHRCRLGPDSLILDGGRTAGFSVHNQPAGM